MTETTKKIINETLSTDPKEVRADLSKIDLDTIYEVLSVYSKELEAGCSGDLLMAKVAIMCYKAGKINGMRLITSK